MREEKACGGGHHKQINDGLRVVETSCEIERAELRNEKFKVVSELRCEIWVDSVFLEVLNSLWLVSVQLHQVLYGSFLTDLLVTILYISG